MLPSSHQPPRIRFEPLSAVCELEAFALPGEHRNQDASASALQTSNSAAALAEAFATFVATSSRLESAYRELQGDVSGLRAELAERNADLKESLSENQRVRLALQKIVDSMPCGVLVVASDGRLTMLNPEARRLLEIPVVDASVVSLSDLEIKHGLELRLTQWVQRGAAPEQEFCWQAQGGERWLHVLVRQIAGETRTGDRDLTILILRDVTSQKRAERDREAARDATVLAQITSMLAHEIRNPLASLELFAQLLEDDATGRAEWLANLRAGIRSLAGTVGNVLSFHDAGALELQPLRLAEIVSSSVSFARPLADQAQASLRWANADHGSRILGNRNAVQQVLLNLIRNAIRYTPAGGSIVLSLEQLGNGEVGLCCTDTGCGISADQIGSIFEPGFSGRGDSPGLGLAICERIMKQHSGSISATNVPDAGARFRLVFPTLSEENPTA